MLVILNRNDFSFELVNDSFTEKTNYSLNELFGKNIWDFNLFDDPSILKSIFNAEYDFCSRLPEITLIAKNNNRLFCEFYAFAFSLAHKPLLLISMLDITQQKIIENQLKAEKYKLEAILDNLPYMAWLKDTKSNFINVNKAFQNSCGKNLNEIIGFNDKSLWSDELAEKYIADDTKVIESKQKLFTEEHIEDKQGGIWFETHKTPIYDENGNIFGTTGMSIDITDRKIIENELLMAKDAAEKANEAKSIFLANMSHEIRTPLNGVLGFLQLLETTELSAVQTEYVNNMKISSKLLKSIINDILDISKMEAVGVELERISFNLISTIEDAVIPFTASATQKNLYVNLFINPSLPSYAVGDPTRLKQVISNILSNSIKFTANGGICIDVSCGKSYGDVFEIKIKIKDTGIGISQDSMKNLFHPFNQADSSTTRKYGGSGLGLSISKSIVEAMSGKIKVKSKIGVGTAFLITVCLNKSNELISDNNDKFSVLNNKNVLIVGENTPNIITLGKYLNSKNMYVTFINKGSDAMISLMKPHEAQMYDAVIISHDLSDIKPNDMLSALKAIQYTKNIPIFLLTSRTFYDYEENSDQISFTANIYVPIRQIDLFTTLTNGICQSEKLLANINHEQDESIFGMPIGNCSNAPCKPFKILIAEDDEINCQYLYKYLVMNNYSCDIATNGKETVSAFAKNHYDAILMDCKMPVVDGYEATKQIRLMESNVKHTPIIALTAYSLESDKNKCFEAGMDEFISKPVNMEKLTSILEKYFIISSLVKENQENITETKLADTVPEYFNKKQKVMIVDDVPMNVSLLKIALESEYDIVVMTNGQDALKVAFSDSPPDIILMDIMMPGMDGYQVCEKLREDPKTKDIPVVFLTAIQDVENEEYGLNLGAIDYIKKPFSIPVVKSKLKNHLDLKKYKDFLKKNSFIDPLTQIANRRKFDEALNVEINKAKRIGTNLSIIMFDIDYFKLYNDTYGHLEGDECLRKVAREFKKKLKRPSDLAARWGGEEFTCMLPDTDKKGAIKVAEKIRKSIEMLGIEHKNSPINDIVTVSVGVVTMNGNENLSSDILLKYADEALYKAKNLGRNRTFIWSKSV